MEKKKEKKAKRLSSLVLLLLITVVMLSTSTYAWFTANKTVTISTIDVNVAVSSGLQISADATSWKTVLSTADITGASYTGVTNQLPTLLAPVSTTNTLNSNGLFDFYSGTVSADTGGNFILTTDKLTEANGTSGNYIAFDVYFRTDTAAPIYLTTSSNVTVTSGHDNIGLQNAARVGFVQQGNASSDTAAAALQALKNQSGITTGTSQVIWEPNFDTHTSYGISEAEAYYGVTGLTQTGASAVSYDGVKATIASTDNVLYGENNASDNASFFSGVTTVTTPATPTGYTQIFQLQKGVTKTRVYIWVEGQDVDCENNASGGYITINMSFSLNSGE